MKNGKILPFGDWFKVYEKAGMNFKKSQQLLESKIFEDKGGVDVPMAGKDLKTTIWVQLAEIKFRDTYNNILTAITANKSNPNVQASIDEMKKLNAIDKNLFSSYTAGISTNESMLALFTAAIAKNLGENSKWIIKNRLLVGPIGVNRNSDSDIKLTPSPDGGSMYTIGRVTSMSATSIGNENKDSVSSYQNLKKYINNFNLAHYIAGNESYDQDSVSEKGFFDFGKAAGALTMPTVYASSIYEGGSVKRSEDETVELIGAETSQVGQADIKFKQATLEQGGANILPGEAPKVEALAKTIMEKFAGKTIDKFELLSSASPEYGKIKNAQGWESNYPNGTTNVGDPGVGTDDASNNAKLAYERGASFMTALNAKLNEMGHPGFANYQIKWQIAAQGGPANDGRFVDLQVSTNEKKGTIEKTTDVKGQPLTTAKTTSGVKEATLYCYEIDF
jgi:hypothetical protein